MYQGVNQLGIGAYIASLIAFAATVMLGIGIYSFYERPSAYLISKALK